MKLDNIRRKLTDLVRDKSITIGDIHKETKLARETISLFLKGGNVAVRTALVLEKFVKESGGDKREGVRERLRDYIRPHLTRVGALEFVCFTANVTDNQVINFLLGIEDIDDEAVDRLETFLMEKHETD